MKQVHLRFYEELNDYLPEDKKKRSFACCFAGRVTVAALLEAIGVPAAEVDLVLCGSEPVGLHYVLLDGDRIAVYPVFESLDLSDTTRVREVPLRRPAFVAGPGLGRLAIYLRLLGFDTCSCADGTWDGTSSRIDSEGRIFLTRDYPPLRVVRAFKVRGTRPRYQAMQVVTGLDLHRRIVPLGRCPRCNFDLTCVGAPFQHCPACGISFCDGPHLRRIQTLIRYLTQA